MDAILYAAGRATRLGPAFADLPKVLLRFGGRTLLDWHVSHLVALGVDRITVVTGHCREKFAEELRLIRDRHGVAVRERFNPDFGEGSVISMLVSLPDIEAAQDSVLLMDGDVLYHRAILAQLIRSQHPTVLLIDRAYSVEDDDPVLVPIRDGRPFEFTKKWTGTADRVGESIGFFKVAPKDLPLLVEETRRRSTGRARLDSYDEVLRALVKAGRFDAEDVTGLPWTEIDFPYDVEYATQSILPALLKKEPTFTPAS